MNRAFQSVLNAIKNPFLRVAFKGIVIIALFVLFFNFLRTFDFRKTVWQLSQAKLGLFGFAILLNLGSWLMQSLLLWDIFKLRSRLLFLSTWSIYCLSAFLGVFLPAKGDYLAQWYFFSKKIPNQASFVLSAIFSYGAIQVLVLIALCFSIALFHPTPFLSFGNQFMIGALLILAIVPLGLFALKKLQLTLKEGILKKLYPLQAFIEILSSAKNCSRLIRWLGIATMLWLFQWAAILCVTHSLEILRLSWNQTLLILLAQTFAFLFPLVPGSFGSFEAVVAWTLMRFGVTTSKALSFSILLHLIHVLPALVLGPIVILLFFKRLSLRDFQRLYLQRLNINQSRK